MQRSLVGLVLVTIALVVFAPIVLGGKTWDDIRYHTEVAPPRIAAADAVLHLQVPTWWEGTALGVPLLAEPTHGAAYPVGWIAATPRTIDLLAVAHVLWCALGIAMWARRRRASELGAVIAGVLVMTSGVIVSAALRGALPAVAHLPWLAFAASIVRAAKSRPRKVRAAIAIAILLALIGLAGQLVVFVEAVALVALMLSRHTRWFVVACVPALAIAALQWLPALAAIGETTGQTLPRIALAHAIDLIIPRANPGWFPTLYIGAPVLVLAALGRPRARDVIAGVALLVSAFAMHGGDIQLALVAIGAASYAAAGFDRVVAWLPRRLLGRLVVVVAALAPTVVALPILVPTIERAVVDAPPAWELAAERVNEWPRRVYRPVMRFAGDKHAQDETLTDAIATLAGTSAAKWGTGAARSEDPARPVTHDRVWAAASSTGGALLARYGIALAILPVSVVAESGFNQLAERGRSALAHYISSPTAAVAYEWIFARDSATALARLFPPGASHGLDSGVIVLAGEGVQNQDEPSPAQPCTIERWDAGAIDLQCNAQRAAYAVVSSTAARGWSARLDGHAAPWLVADVMRRAIAVSPGTHRIAWRYWPPGLTIALVLAALGIVSVLALWLVYGRDSYARDRTSDPERTDVN